MATAEAAPAAKADAAARPLVMPGTEGDVLDGGVRVLDERLAKVQVQSKAGEEKDENLPRSLHNAAELFLDTGKVDAARQLQESARVFFELCVQGPATDPAGMFLKFGTGIVCWICGHAGLPREGQAPAGAGAVCSKCGECVQTNFVQALLNDGVAIPWMERPPEEAAPAATDLSNVDPRLTSVQVEPNADEASHANFPRNMFKVLELFVRVGHSEQAKRALTCGNKFLGLLEAGPNPANQMGRGLLCFNCGNIGLPHEAEKRVCAACSEDSHANWLKTVLPNGQELPWMERWDGPRVEEVGAEEGGTRQTAQAAAKAKAKAKGRVKPNEPCSCGSGLKAKKCCHVGGV